MGRKLGTVVDSTGRMPLQRCDPSMVQGAFQIVEDITDNQREFLSRELVRNVIHDFLAGDIRVMMNESGAGVFQPADSPLEVADVMIGPLYF